MNARMNRLFAADGRCFDVAIDQGFFGEGSFLAGIENVEAAIATLVDAAPDAIQLSPGRRRCFSVSPAGRRPSSTSARRTQLRSVSGVHPTFPAIETIAAHLTPVHQCLRQRCHTRAPRSLARML